MVTGPAALSSVISQAGSAPSAGAREPDASPAPPSPGQAEQPVRGPGQRQFPELGAAAGGLPGQRLQRGGRAQVAGAVVEQLARQRAGPLAVRRFRHRDPGRRLHDAVEPPPAAPGTAAAPRRQADHHQAGMPFGQRPRSQPEPLERVRPVPVHQDVGGGEQLVQPGVPAGRAEVEQRAALARQPVVGVQGQLRPVRCVDAEHVRAERAEVPGGHRAGDDPGQVEHPDARGRPRARGPPARRRASDRRPLDQGGRGDRLPGRLSPPAVLRTDGGGHPAGAGHQVLSLPCAKLRQRRRDRFRVTGAASARSSAARCQG